MDPVTGGYVTDVAYPTMFHREMTPCWLTVTAAALGYGAPDIARPYRWCELGCGPGLGLALTAAANPGGRFVGVDFNPDHIAHGRRLTEAAGLGNLTFRQEGFETMEPEGGEAFDFIVLHGVYSWVSPAVRAAIHGFIGRFLAPGGLVYVNYMTHPGLSAFAAGQKFLRLYGRSVGGGSARQAQAGLAALKALDEAGAGCFAAHPEERARLATAAEDDARYLAHEFMNEHWEPLHVADVMRAFAGTGCAHLGSATPVENIDALSLPGHVLPLLKGMADPELRETVKDLARNQSYRRDLYQRGGGVLAPADHLRALRGLALAALPGAPKGGGLTFDTRIGPVEGAAPLFDPLLRALARGPQGFDALAAAGNLGGNPGLLNQAVQMLCWSGCAHGLRPGPAEASGNQTSGAWALNRVVAEAALGGADYRWLAAPAIGSALPAGPAEMALCLAALDNPRQDRKILGRAAAERLGRPLDPALFDTLLPAWTALGVVPKVRR